MPIAAAATAAASVASVTAAAARALVRPARSVPAGRRAVHRTPLRVFAASNGDMKNPLSNLIPSNAPNPIDAVKEGVKEVTERVRENLPQKVGKAGGGEWYVEDNETLTTAAGVPVGDNQNSLTAGPGGPILLQDFHLYEKNVHFNRERIPPRVVHEKGVAAHGKFTITGDISKYTRAKALQPGEHGAADTVRDLRGFAMKIYTDEGNWDLVGNNTPIFFVRDPMKFTDFIHTQKRDPRTGFKSWTNRWDFWSLSPESTHQLIWFFGDRGIPYSYRYMNGYGSHAFSLINENDERVWVKFHWKSQQGTKNMDEPEAIELAGKNPDHYNMDLYKTIEDGDYPKWTFYVQIMTEEQADAQSYNVFDLTKTWPHAEFPLIEVGEVELNRNPLNYFEEVEQAAFAPSNVPPGIGFSPDPMLQARTFAYKDAHVYRLGVNYDYLNVNRPKNLTQTYHRDGFMRNDGNGGNNPDYEPNSFGGPRENLAYKEKAGVLYDQVFTEDERQRVVERIMTTFEGITPGFKADPVPVRIRELALINLANASDDLGRRLAAKMEVDLDEVRARRTPERKEQVPQYTSAQA
eukprot:jgi/Chlat1/8891/Chrsp92S00688